MIQQTTKLPDGYTATFSFEDGCLVIEWSPHVPLIRNARKLRRFMAAYRAARDAFMGQVATVQGGNVLVLDVDSSSIGGTVVQPMVPIEITGLSDCPRLLQRANTCASRPDFFPPCEKQFCKFSRVKCRFRNGFLNRML
jgi:hypothetical protein